MVVRYRSRRKKQQKSGWGDLSIGGLARDLRGERRERLGKEGWRLTIVCFAPRRELVAFALDRIAA